MWLSIYTTCIKLTEERKSKENQSIISGYLPLKLLSNPKFEHKPTERIPKRLVFFNGGTIWKFCESYGVTAHQKAFELGITPKFEEIPFGGNWKLIAMEKLEGKTLLCEDISHDEKLWCSFVAKMNEFNKSFFHGDVRKPNIIFTNTGYYLVDFEWSGEKDTKIYYPASINTDGFHTSEEIGAFKQIKPIHDQWHLDDLTNDLFNNKQMHFEDLTNDIID